MEQVLSAAGIQGSLAKAYIALLDVESVSPSVLRKHINESRPNTYKLLDELVERGLAKGLMLVGKLQLSGQKAPPTC